MEHFWLANLRDSSTALQAVLGAVLEAERRFAPPASPLERLRQITTSPEWEWLQPLYRLIADIDHALAYANDLPAARPRRSALMPGNYCPVLVLRPSRRSWNTIVGGCGEGGGAKG